MTNEIKHSYSLKVYKEEEISWQLQNEIHKILNVSFAGISDKFITKTYAHIRPSERVLGYLNEELVAHIGISSDEINLNNNKKIEVSCLGLWASTRSGWATKVIATALEYLESKDVSLAIGISNNEIILKRVIPKFRHIALDVQMKGKNFSSKVTDKIILFPILISDEELIKIVNEILKSKVIHIQGEPF